MILSCGMIVTGMIGESTKFGVVTAAFDSKLEFFSSCSPKPKQSKQVIRISEKVSRSEREMIIKTRKKRENRRAKSRLDLVLHLI